MPSTGQYFHVDTSAITRLAQQLGGTAADRVVRNRLTTAMQRSTEHVAARARARIKHKSGLMGRSMKKRVTVNARTITGMVDNTARSSAGYFYPARVEFGRGPVHAKRAKMLRFTVGGQVFFRKSVGPAPAQHVMEFGLRDAEPLIVGEFARARDAIAADLERL